MTKDDVVQMAKEAGFGNYAYEARGMFEHFANLVVAFKPKQEPIAWMVYAVDGKSAYVTDNPNDLKEGQSAYALYPGPFEHKPLTDEEIKVAHGITEQTHA